MSELRRLDTKEFRPEVNVLVVPCQSPTGMPRFEVRSGDVVPRGSRRELEGRAVCGGVCQVAA